MKTPYLILAIILLTFASCEKDEDNTPVLRANEAILNWTGEYAVDGCGYIFDLDNEDYKAVNDSIIPDSLKGTAVSVYIEYYKVSDIRNMCFSPTPGGDFKGMKIKSISKIP